MEMYSCQPLFDRLTHVVVKTGAIQDFCKRKTPLDKIKFCLDTEVRYDDDMKICIRTEIQDLLNALYEKCAEHGKSEALALQAKNKGSKCTSVSYYLEERAYRQFIHWCYKHLGQRIRVATSACAVNIIRRLFPSHLADDTAFQKAYLKRRDAEALDSFTECLRLAPADSTVLPLAYANRSAVLFQMGRYEEALQDISRAEGSGYPAALQHKLLTRRCHCCLILGIGDEAKTALESCKEYSQSVPVEAREKYEKAVADLEQKVMNLILTKKVTSCQDVLEHPSLIQGESSYVKYMTSAFEMRASDKYGRHIVAADEVSKGSVVFMEKPYAAILLPEYLNTHCHTCFTPATNPVPCKYCCDAIFCKEECRELGRTWHQYECGILHILSSVGIAHLALRVIIVAGWKLCCDIRNETTEGRIAGVGKKGVYNGPNLTDGYRSVYHLMPHFESCLPEDQLQYCLAAVLLATAVHNKTDFPKHSEDVSKCDVHIDVPQLACALMRHIAQLVSNAHAVTQIMASGFGQKSKTQQVLQKRVASAIYPTASLMNHSCKPNIINSFYKDLLVIRTVQDVIPGDHINNCYGLHYCRQTRKERQESLRRQYFFSCKCLPCIQPEYLQKEVVHWSNYSQQKYSRSFQNIGINVQYSVEVVCPVEIRMIPCSRTEIQTDNEHFLVHFGIEDILAAWSGFLCENCRGVLSWMDQGDPSGGDLGDSRGVLLCLQCHKLQRPSTHLIETCSKVNLLHEAGEEALRRNDISTAVSHLRSAISVGSAVYQPENQYFVSVRDTLAQALIESGNYESCCLELRECLRVIESRYGSESVELAHELLKFADVLALAATTKDKFQDEAARVKKRLDDIFTLNYGPHWKKYLQTYTD